MWREHWHCHLEERKHGPGQHAPVHQWEIQHNPTMTNYLLEFSGGFLALARQQVRLSPKVNRVQHPYLKWFALSQLVGCGGLQNLQRCGGVFPVNFDSRTN